MNGLLTLWAWLAAGVRALAGRAERDAALADEFERDLAAFMAPSHPVPPTIDACKEAWGQVEGLAHLQGFDVVAEGPAHVEDHGAGARREAPLALVTPSEREEVGGFVPLLGPRPDTLLWVVEAPASGWSLWGTLATGKPKTITLGGDHLAVGRGHGGKSWVLSTGDVRIEIRGAKAHAEVQTRAPALDRLGAEGWVLEVWPRVARWLGIRGRFEGEGLEGLGLDALEEVLVAHGVELRGHEEALDCHGIPTTPDRASIISRMDAQEWRVPGGEVSGIEVGRRRSPCSVCVYRADLRRARGRGEPREVLAVSLDEAGRDHDRPLVRIEGRHWGPGLSIVDEHGEVHDFTRPFYFLREPGLLWRDALTRVRFVELTGRARARDEADLDEWRAARALGGSAEPLRASRVAVRRQVAETVRRAETRLGQSVFDVGVLRVGLSGPVGLVGMDVRKPAAAEARVAGLLAADLLTRGRRGAEAHSGAVAKYGGLIEQAREGEA